MNGNINFLEGDIQKACSVLIAQNSQILSDNKLLWNELNKKKENNQKKVEKLFSIFLTYIGPKQIPEISFLQKKHNQEKAHLNSIETLSISKQNPNTFATGSHDHLIKLWDLNTFKETQLLRGHSQGVWSTQFSNDGKQLLSASPDKTLIIWDLNKGKPTSTLKEHLNKVYFCQYNEDNKLIASGGEDQRLIIWDTRKGTAMKIIESENKIIYNIKWSKDGNYLCTSEYGGICKIFDAKNFNLIAQFGSYNEEERSRYVNVLELSPKNQTLTKEYEFIAHMDPIKCLNIDGEKQLLITSCRDGSARVWEAFKRQNQYSPKTIGSLIGHEENVSSIQFVAVGGKTLLLTSSYDQKVHLFEI
ncbi:WD40 repeat protein [Ichthyophthirius multifiliis]|uniref:WD40 repeat protein n=1 Tax=Ichthyophthirius multifiliis TaxID=5932 RepID=G0QPS8_ICHMU|nr:WD40 repeat protein [Ichthyophthirius multifiliis]EGR32793.1 WD40 repeat protein [Ichthyophthirius multifiliis]|eukprot:XP_004036779.1 WD40 repeat protein [Ichthyophthirius multifiliis]